MEQTVFVADPTRLLIAAAVGIIVLLVLIIRFKLHPVISMMIAAIVIGVGAGMPLTMISETVEKGVGKTDRKSTRLNSSHYQQSRMPSSA